MSAEHTEVTILAVATHPVHGRVIVFERSEKFVFLAPVISEYPFYGQDFAVPVDEYEREYREEAGVELEAQCITCGATCNLTDTPDHILATCEAERQAVFKLFRCCGTGQSENLKFTWLRSEQ